MAICTTRSAHRESPADASGRLAWERGPVAPAGLILLVPTIPESHPETLDPPLHLVNGHPIHARHSSVRPDPCPRHLQHISAINPIIQGVAPKVRLPFGLKTQFPSQKRNLLRQPRLRLEPVRPLRSGALLAQAAHPSLDRSMTQARPLCSTGITRFPVTGPFRLPATATLQVIDSPQVVRPRSSETRSAPGLPGSSTDLSTRALPNHPGRLDECSRSLLLRRWQASSPSLAGRRRFSVSRSIGFKAHVFTVQGGSLPFASHPTTERPAYLPCLATCTEDRSSMRNGQLTCLTLFSQIDSQDCPGLPGTQRKGRY